MKKFKVVEKKNIEDLNIDELRGLYSNLQGKLAVARKKVEKFEDRTDVAIMMASMYAIASFIFIAFRSIMKQPLGNLDLMSMATFDAALVSSACLSKAIGHKVLGKKVDDLMEVYSETKKELEYQSGLEHKRILLEREYHELKDLLERLNSDIKIDGDKDYTRADSWSKVLTKKIEEQANHESFGTSFVNSSVINFEGVQQFFRYMLSKPDALTKLNVHSVSYYPEIQITFEFQGLSKNGEPASSGLYTIFINDNESKNDYACILLPDGKTIYLTKDGKISKISSFINNTAILVENDLYKDIPVVRTEK